jgi:hypothetical protein
MHTKMHTCCLVAQVGEGEFGVVYKAKYLGTTLAVKVLKDTNVVALGDFRYDTPLLDKQPSPALT